jgi:hypothetical protein
MSGLRINIPTSELEDGENLAPSISKDVIWHTPWPYRQMCWGLLGNKGTISQNHMDACGTCTHVRVLLGCKIWFVALDEKIPDTGGFSNEITWQQVILQSGDDLYMRPGSRHFVLGTEDTFIVGGHFYSRSCYSRTFDAITMEHYLGDFLTNADHSYSAIVLFKLLRSYEITLLMDRTTEEPFPDLEELASLILLVLYLEQLWPQTEEMYATYPWHSTSDFMHDYPMAAIIAVSVARQMQEVDNAFQHHFQVREKTWMALCQELEKGQPDETLIVTFRNFWKNIFDTGTSDSDFSVESSSSNDEASSDLSSFPPSDSSDSDRTSWIDADEIENDVDEIESGAVEIKS